MTPARPRVLIVESNEAVNDALTAQLRQEGFRTYLSQAGSEAIAAFDAIGPDLVLLDVELADMAGLEACRLLRRRSTVPIVLVATTTTLDPADGLDAGADDYITRPYRSRELVARLRAVLRRVAPAADDIASEPIEVGDVHLDPARRELHVRGVRIHTTLKEFDLLRLLMENAGQLVSRETLAQHIWGTDYAGCRDTLRAHIRHLRAKLRTDRGDHTPITFIRPLGYRYELPEPDGQ